MKTQNQNSDHSNKPVWFITGCSTGFGRELATHLLERGFRTVVTARNPDDVKDLASKGKALILELDVTDQGQVDTAIKAAKEKFGHIDVLVNNAFNSTKAKLHALGEEFDKWEAVFRGADFPKEAHATVA